MNPEASWSVSHRAAAPRNKIAYFVTLRGITAVVVDFELGEN